MEIYLPDMYQKSIYAIDYDKLKSRGIQCLLFDLDNTLVPYNVKEPNNKVVDLFIDLKKKGFKVIIMTNSPKKRAVVFKDMLDVDCCANAKKPKSDKFKMILEEYKFPISEVAIIGDQILTDVVGGNRVGITTILVNPISKSDMIFTKINRIRENSIMKKLRKRDLFTKGRYYE